MDSRERAAVWAEVRRVAAGQHGIVLSHQVRDAGLTDWQIRRLTAEGMFVHLRRGAWLLGGTPPSDWQQAVAAALVCGPEAVLSHATAARAYKMPGLATTPVIEVTIPAGLRRRLPGAVVHRSRTVDPRDVQLHRGVRVTSPARTLVDLADRLPPGALAKIIDEGLISRLWTVEDLRTRVESRTGPGAPARDAVSRLLEERADLPRADTHLEARAIRALAPLGPFVTGYQVVLDGHVFLLDIAWPDLLVAAECDGWTVRSRSRSKFDHDRRRGNLLEAHGWSVAHLTTSMPDDEMRSVVFRLLLAAAGRIGSDQNAPKANRPSIDSASVATPK